MHKLLAQIDLGPIGGGKPDGLGPLARLATDKNSTAGLTSFAAIISGMIGIMTISAGIWFIFQFMTGGFFWITSSGEKAKLHEARERITNGLIGLVIVVAAWAIIAITGQFLGIDIFLNDPKKIIDALQLK